MKFTSRSLLLFGAFALAVLPLGCSDSDSPTGVGNVDTTAPTVLSVTPGQSDTGVGLSDNLVIVFNEAMSPATTVANVTLSAGTVSALNWTSSTTLQVSHSAWANGVNVSASLSTAFQDTSANALAAPYAWDFWTVTSAPEVLDSSLPEGATDVSRNATITFLFSEPMNLASLDAATTLTNNGVVPKAGQGFQWTEGDGSAAVLSFNPILDANTSYRVDVASVALTQSGTQLGTAFQLNFVTGTTSDTTPPNLVSIVPASGSTIPASTSSIVFTFDEAIDPNNFDPSMVSAQLEELLAEMQTDPAWSEDGTQLTVALPTPLPAGLPIAVRFDAYQDLAGNIQTTPIDYRVDVAGTPDFWPFVNNREQVWFESWYRTPNQGEPSGGSGQQFLRYEQQGGGTFRVVGYDDFQFSMPNGYEEYRPMSSAVQLVAFGDYDMQTLSTTTLSPAVEYQRIPFTAQSWSGTTTASSPDGNASISYTVTVVGQEDVYYGGYFKEGHAKIPDGPGLVWVDCWKAALEYQMIDPISESVVSSGVDSLWFAPVTGMIQRKSFESGEEGTNESIEVYVGPPSVVTKQ